MRVFATVVFSAFALAASAALAAPTTQHRYHFTRLAKMTNPFASSHATIASNGDVAYVDWEGGLLDPSISALHAVTGGVARVVEADGPSLMVEPFGPFFSINANGRIVFMKADPSPFVPTMWCWFDNARINLSGHFSGRYPVNLPVLNDQNVVFCTTLSPSSFDLAVERIDSDGGTPVGLFGSADGFDFRGYERRLSANNAGQVALSTLDSQKIIRATSLSDLQTIAESVPALRVSINDAGTVAWHVSLGDPDPGVAPGVYRASGGGATPLWPENSAIQYAPQIMSDDRVCFLSSNSTDLNDFVGIADGVGAGFVVLSAAEADLGESIVFPGIPVDSAQWMNASGQFVLEATLSSGEKWLLRADPAPPCPADLTLDGQTDDLDFQIFAVAYDILDCADPSMPAGCASDLNSDGLVDDTDFSIFAVAYDTLVCP